MTNQPISLLRFGVRVLLLLGVALSLAAPAQAQVRGRAMKKAGISRQEPPLISPRVLQRVTPENASILIILSRQRAYLMLGGEIAIDTPVSTGKAAGMTPTGSFRISEKDIDHRSNLYGDFVDSRGRVVRAGVSVRIDSAPSGTRFRGAPMAYFLRVHGAVGMHVGYLPGYPASHGCIRMPSNIAPQFYERVKIGTPVEIIR